MIQKAFLFKICRKYFYIFKRYFFSIKIKCRNTIIIKIRVIKIFRIRMIGYPPSEIACFFCIF